MFEKNREVWTPICGADKRDFLGYAVTRPAAAEGSQRARAMGAIPAKQPKSSCKGRWRGWTKKSGSCDLQILVCPSDYSGLVAFYLFYYSVGCLPCSPLRLQQVFHHSPVESAWSNKHRRELSPLNLSRIKGSAMLGLAKGESIS